MLSTESALGYEWRATVLDETASGGQGAQKHNTVAPLHSLPGPLPWTRC